MNRYAEVFWLRFSKPGFPVVLPALRRTKHFRWTGIYGIQIGKWFVGAINGGEDVQANRGSETP